MGMYLAIAMNGRGVQNLLEELEQDEEDEQVGSRPLQDCSKAFWLSDRLRTGCYFCVSIPNPKARNIFFPMTLMRPIIVAICRKFTNVETCC